MNCLTAGTSRLLDVLCRNHGTIGLTHVWSSRAEKNKEKRRSLARGTCWRRMAAAARCVWMAFPGYKRVTRREDEGVEGAWELKGTCWRRMAAAARCVWMAWKRAGASISRSRMNCHTSEL